VQRLRHAIVIVLAIVSLAVASAALPGGMAAYAVQPDEVLADPALETRARALSRELRCMVCQNQSIDDSDAPLARDLRLLVRERLKAGDTDAEVEEFLVARYGEFVLLRPRLSWGTAFLWGAPAAVLCLGFLVAFMHLRRRRALLAIPTLAPHEERRIEALLRETADIGSPPGRITKV